ncbi:phage tail protein [Thalassovita aquimarina]|uniref:Phage tail protein n=1 Tax=Thalassovita aquimarina TaxID=2785917 RepID=A0ABS5HSE9_9RHOB|nr:phage tail protein [Thalassovita aquimarina]MBR9651902.1 phage tail protein [Thalassovita aquimarina]
MFSVGDVDMKGLQRFDNMLGSLGAEAPKAANRAINRTGDMARTQVIKALAKQTGLPQKTIRRSVKVKRSSWSDLTYTLKSAGGDVSLKYFQKRETREGVVANLGAGRGRELFPRTFFRGGAFPRRVDLTAFGGHVMDRMSEGRFHLKKVKSGVFIPEEMVDGATAEAFERSVEQNLPRRLDHEISRALGL